MEINSKQPASFVARTLQNEESKQPPAEDAATIKAKRRAIFSFWFVVLFLGLPVWLWTTSIHRANLPVQEMLAWANGKVSS